MALHALASPIPVDCKEDLEAVIKKMADTLQESQEIQLGGFVSLNDFILYLKAGISDDYAHKWRYSYKSQGGPILIELELMDSTRLLAAVRKPEIARKLTLQEKHAYNELKKRLERFKFEGFSRLEIIKAVQDDLYLRAGYPMDRGKDSCLFLLQQNKGNRLAHASYFYLIMSLYDIPCKIVHACGSCWNMVQLEKGDWYHVSYYRDSQHPLPVLTDKEFLNHPKKDFRTRYKYPPTPDENQCKLTTCSTMKMFWKAAEEAYNAGNKSYSAVLADFPGKSKFEKSLQKYLSSGGVLRVDSMYLPGAAIEQGLVRVFFRAEDDAPEPDTGKKNNWKKVKGTRSSTRASR